MGKLDKAISRLKKRLNLKPRTGYLGDGTGEVRDRANPGKYLVRFLQANGSYSSPVSLPAIANANIPVTTGTPVEVGFDANGKSVILGVNLTAKAATGDNPLRLNPLDDQSNGFVNSEKITTFYATRHADSDTFPFYAVVFPGLFYSGSTFTLFVGDSIDLSGLVPASGEHCFVVVFLKTDGALEAFASTAVDSGDPIGFTDINEALALGSADSLPIRAWQLDGDDTVLTVDDNKIVDLRVFLNGPSGGGGGGTPASSVTDETTYGISPAVGTDTEYARQDHTHGSVPHDAHGNLTGVTSDQHHARSHDHSNASDGSTLTPATLNIPTSAAPAQTVDGRSVWDSVLKILTIGDGTARKLFGYLGSTNPQPLGTAAPGTSVEASRVDHVHLKPVVAAYEDGVSVVADTDKIDWKDVNAEDGGSNDTHIYINSPYICDGRLTLTTGVPITASDVNGATSIYFAPYKGSQVSLYDGTRWKRFNFTELSLSLSGLIKGVCYDIFLYDNAGTRTLESLAWKKVTASNSPTAGANKVINLADTATLAIGMEVTVRDGTNSEVTNITAVVASTSITVDNLVNSYTLPDVYGYQARATALTTQDGVYVKSGDTTRRYLGTIRIDRATTGQCSDTVTECNLWNYYHPQAKRLICGDTTNTWTYGSATIRAANASVAYGVARVGFVIGLAERLVSAINYQPLITSVAATFMTGIGLDTTLANIADAQGTATSASANDFAGAHYGAIIGIGNHYLQRVEAGPAGTTTLYGDNNTTLMQSGMAVDVTH